MRHRTCRYASVTGAAALLAAAMLAAPTAGAAVSVTVHDDVVKHTVRPDYTGTNFVAYWNDIGADPGSINDMKASDFKVIRFPGGIPCDWFDWQQAESASNRTILDAAAVAAARSGRLLYQTNIYDANGTGQNSAATVQAIDAYMKAHGIQVAMWEGGNEPEYGPNASQGAPTYMAQYNATFGTQYTALKAVSPSIPMVGPGTTSLGNLELFLKAHGNKQGDGKTDGVSFHWYAGGGFSISNGYDYRRDAAQTSLAATVASINTLIATYDTRTLPVYITEWNWITAGGWGDYDFTFTGVYDADVVGMMLQLGVAGNTQFCLDTIAQSYGMIANWDGYRAPKRNDVNSAFYALSLAQKLGTSVLQVDNPADPGHSLSVYATKTGDGKLQVMLCNKDVNNAQDVTLSFTTYDPTGKSVEINTLSSPSIWGTNVGVLNGVSFPQPQTTGTFPAPAVATAAGSTYGVHLPANGSMAVLIFDAASGGTTSGTTTSGTTTSGTTTSGTTTSGTTTSGTTTSGTTTSGTTTSGTTTAGTATSGTTTSGTTTAGTTTGSTTTSGTTAGTSTGSTTTSGTTTSGTSTAGTATGATTGTGATDPSGHPQTQCGLGAGLGLVLGALALWRRRQER